MYYDIRNRFLYNKVIISDFQGIQEIKYTN